MTPAEYLAAELDDTGMNFVITREMYGAFEGAFGGLVAAASLIAARGRADGRRPIALDCRFLRGLQAGKVRARTELVRAGRSVSVVDVRIHDSNGRLAATATASFADTEVLHDLDDAEMVRPGASVDYAEASPFQLRRVDVPIIGTLEPRVALTDPGLMATVLKVPWTAEGAGPEAACLAADMSVGPPVVAELGSDWVPHPNPDLSLRFATEDCGDEIAGVTRVERVGSGVAALRIEVFSGVDLVAVGCSVSLLLGMAVADREGTDRPGA